MRKIPVARIKEGMVLAKTVFNIDGNVLLNSGMKLRESYVRKFADMGIYEVYIDDAISHDIEINDVISDETRFEARIAIKNAMDKVKYGSNLEIKPVRNVVGNIVDEPLNSRETMINLQDIKASDQYTFSHSVNVCVMSVITGISLGYDKDKLRELGMGAILHDVGKTKVPNEILNKPGLLTDEEFDIMKKHTVFGYEILKKSVELSTYVSYIAYTHHEKYNGEGYPLGILGNDIHEFSRIVAISDVYDAITSNRAYRKRSSISEAVEYLVGMGNHHFDYAIVRKFLEHISIYPLGTCVVLNTGETGIVVDINKKFPIRPVIRLVKDQYGNMIDTKEEIDLTKHNTILITDVAEDI